MDLTLVLDELALVVAFPERAERGFIRECVVIADERLQVLGRLWAVICGSRGQLIDSWSPQAEVKETGGG